MNIDRDNFRHLTGFGRDMANYVDEALSTLTRVNESSFGCDINVFHDVDTDRIDCTTTDHPQDGIPTHSMLMLVTIRNNKVETMFLPLVMVLCDSPDLTGKYVLYRHGFADKDFEKLRYYGITKRGWRTRWAEHLRAANSGSHYRFHQAIRQWYGKANVVSHLVMGCGLSENEAMAMEEEKIAQETLYPLGLNMVPGGNAGLAYLRKIGALGKNERIAPDDRQDIINRFFERASRKGLPNPLAAANWLNPNYAESVICAGQDRLKPQQIRDARLFSSLGQDADVIATQVGARNVEQIRRMLTGATYSRIL